MTNPTFRDIELLSIFLDGQLSRVDGARLETRLASDRDLAAALADLRISRSILRRTPRRPAPRNFTLTPKMSGIRPPLPPFVPVLNWASAVAALLFIITLGTNLLGRLSFGAAAPLMASAPAGMGGGYGGGPADTTAQEPMVLENAIIPTSVSAEETLKMPQATPVPDERLLPPESPRPSQTRPVYLWYLFWPTLALLLLGVAQLIRWNSVRAFHHKSDQK